MKRFQNINFSPRNIDSIINSSLMKSKLKNEREIEARVDKVNTECIFHEIIDKICFFFLFPIFSI